MIVRPEKQCEFPAIRALIQRAFETARVADGREQDFTERLRADGGYIPELALVAEDGGALIGHVMLTKTSAEDEAGHVTELLLLAPLSVVLERRNAGVGGVLVREAMARAAAAGHRAVVLVGDPAYYSRFGFRSSADFGIVCDGGIEAKYVQAAELFPHALDGISGTLRIPH